MVVETARVTRYRSLSSIARILLPEAERMHREGMSWREIAEDLKVSYSALFIWRRLEEDRRSHRSGVEVEVELARS